MHPFITKSACDITSYYIFSTFIHFYFKNNELSKIYHISKAIIFHTHTHTLFFPETRHLSHFMVGFGSQGIIIYYVLEMPIICIKLIKHKLYLE